MCTCSTHAYAQPPGGRQMCFHVLGKQVKHLSLCAFRPHMLVDYVDHDNDIKIMLPTCCEPWCVYALYAHL